MKLNPSREYLKGLLVEERQCLAKQLGISQEYLYQIGSNFRNPSRELAIKLEIMTNGKVKESDFVEEIKNSITIT